MSQTPRLPDRTVVLTFDDTVSNHATFVGPLLHELGLRATFYICEFPPDFATNKRQYMTWEQIRGLSDLGFEIGNHTQHHSNVTTLSCDALYRELEFMDRRCKEYGIPVPTTFCYPGCCVDDRSVNLLAMRGYRLARIGSERPFVPGQDNGLLAPSFPVHGDDPAKFDAALAQTQEGQAVILMYHGVPDELHPWVTTPPALFEAQMRRLASEGYTVLAMRDLEAYLPD